jgi:lysophospholipase L1-like esterase
VIAAGIVLTGTGGSPSSVFAQTYRQVEGKNPAFAEVVEAPGLPRVLIIGDSISIGYTPDLQKKLIGKANVHRVPVNAGPTTRGVEQLDQWLGDQHWDVIHFNFGLHDLKFVDEKGQAVSPDKGRYQVPLEEYEQNLRQIVARLQKTGAKLIWRNTTPVPENAGIRIAGDERKYNDVAAQIMQEHKIPIDDHHTFVLKNTKGVQRPANVHFTAEGSEKLAELAATKILESLKQ